jgi:hypothetical protein
MSATLQVITLMLVALGMAMTVGHALELPGKMRLSKEEYFAVQPIYYPGFTIGSIFGEFGSMVATAILLFVTPWNTTAFWLVFAALLSLLAMHALYWVLTHPVNKIWLKGHELTGGGATFFSIGGSAAALDWEAARKQWEYSHVARAVLSAAALALIATATAIEG